MDAHGRDEHTRDEPDEDGIDETGGQGCDDQERDLARTHVGRDRMRHDPGHQQRGLVGGRDNREVEAAGH